MNYVTFTYICKHTKFISLIFKTQNWISLFKLQILLEECEEINSNNCVFPWGYVTKDSNIILVSPKTLNFANCKEGCVLYWAAQPMQISAVEGLLALCSVAFTPDVLARCVVHLLPPELSLGLGQLTPVQNIFLQNHSCRFHRPSNMRNSKLIKLFLRI